MSLAAVVDLHESGKWTESKYRAERDALKSTYGEKRGDAPARYDQELASLFYRSGWTQEELAKVEGIGRQRVTQKLLFGRFLAFATSGSNPPIPSNLTERAFRSYWERTNKNEGNERKRFIEVQRLLAEQTVVRAPRRSGLGRKIIDEFGDGKWHKIETIAAHVEEPAESLIPLLSHFGSPNNSWGIALCEKRRVGAKDGTWSYRIVKGGQKIDLTALTQELLPILKELETQGTQHRALCSPPAVLSCVHAIRKLLEALAQPAAPSR